ncbi:MAG: phage holin family protein [Acidobacteriota bacterium]|nr:phage holin family protein [Acidobacteriota bacterium]
MTTTDQARPNATAGLERRPTGELVAAIGNDIVTLVRQEADLAKKEITEALVARTVALAVGLVAGVLSVLMLVFLGLAASQALGYEIPMWAARLTVAGLLGGVILLSLPLMVRFLRRPELRPAETLRTTKEDFEWAKAQLKR